MQVLSSNIQKQHNDFTHKRFHNASGNSQKTTLKMRLSCYTYISRFQNQPLYMRLQVQDYINMNNENIMKTCAEAQRLIA